MVNKVWLTDAEVGTRHKEKVPHLLVGAAWAEIIES